MNIEEIWPQNSPNSQKARGVFSPAKKIDLGTCHLILVSGQQPPKDPNTHAVPSDDIEWQTESTFESIAQILKSAGANMDDVVRAQIFLTDIADLSKVSAIRDKWFKNSRPASTILEVSGMTRTGAKIEIEVTAIKMKAG